MDNSVTLAIHCRLQEFLEVLSCVSDADYARQPNVLGMSSSIGSHLRHAMDYISVAIVSADEQGNYHERKRGGDVESSIEAARQRVEELSARVDRLADRPDHSAVLVADVVGDDSEICMMSSTLERELAFASLHAVHHLAIIKTILALYGTSVSPTVGVAPSTQSWARAQSH